jgi:hypothetical protein
MKSGAEIWLQTAKTALDENEKFHHQLLLIK